MIPKIIHYCWLSGEPYPESIKRCLDSWKRYCPDYEYKLWTQENFDIDSVPIVRAAVDKRKWAFAADYIRLYAVYNYGGVYLDSDVELFKSLDDYLQCKAFWGTDTVPGGLRYCYPEAGVFGAEKGVEYIADIMNYYEKLSGDLSKEVLDKLDFMDVDKNSIFDEKGKGRLCIAPIPIGYYLNKQGYENENRRQSLPDGTEIYPTPIFINHCFKPTKETVALHHNTGSWCDFAPRGLFYKFCHKMPLLVPFYKWVERLNHKYFIDK